MRILVTGGTVFVSKYIAEYFSESGNEVYVLNRNTRPQLPKVKLIECDRNGIGKRLVGLHFDAVIDVTAYTAEDINGLLDCIESFDDYVFISSSAVYPETLELPFKESDRIGANKFWGDYGTNKIAAERALLKRVRDAYILRPPYLYGEYNNIYREAFVFDCAENESPFYLPKDGSMPLQFFHVEDLCRVIEKLLGLKPEKRIYNVGNAPVTAREWVELCYAAVGAVPKFVNVTGDVEQRNYFPFCDYTYELDTTAQSKIIDGLLPMKVGLRRAYAWYGANKNEVRRKNYQEYIKNNFEK